MGTQQNIIVSAASLKIDGIDVGFTQGGITLRKSNEWVDVDADQLGGVARKVRTFERCMLTTVLLEATLTHLRRAMNEASGQQVGSHLSIGSGSLGTNEFVLTVTGKGPSGATRTWTFTRAIFVDDVDHVLGARDQASTIPIGFELLKDPAYNDRFGWVVDT